MNIYPLRFSSSIDDDTLKNCNRSSDWGVNGGSRKCEKETEPILDMSRPIDVGINRKLYEIAVNVVKKSTKLPISFLNITKISEYRKDGHTSFYGSRNGKLVTPEEESDPTTFADCYHWCLPGLPDTWNELLSLYIIYKTWIYIFFLRISQISEFFLSDSIGKFRILNRKRRENGEEDLEKHSRETYEPVSCWTKLNRILDYRIDQFTFLFLVPFPQGFVINWFLLVCAHS